MIGYHTTIVLTSGTSTVLPADFNPTSNIIGCLGAGGTGYFGGDQNSTYPAGGGAYAWKLNIQLLPGTTCIYSIGAAGFQATDTCFFGNITSVATSAGSALGSSILTFASVPSWVSIGMKAYDLTAAGSIKSGQFVTGTSSTLVTLSAGLDGAVGSGDVIYFDSGPLVVGKGGGNSPGATNGGQAASCIGNYAYSGGDAVHGTSPGGGAAGPNGPGIGNSADGGTVNNPTLSGTEFDSTHGCGIGGDVHIGLDGKNYGGGGGANSGAGAGAPGLLVIGYNLFSPQAAMLLGL